MNSVQKKEEEIFHGKNGYVNAPQYVHCLAR